MVYPDGNSLRKEYDEWGRLIKSIDAKNQVETFYYDASNNMIGSVDRKGNRFKYSFNNRNMLLSSELVNAQGNPLSVNEKVSYQYDLAGKRKQMSDVTGTTSYTYNPNTGQLVEVQFPDAKTIKYDYDATGSRIAMKDPFGINTYYRYNANNQLEIVSSSLNFTRDYVAKYQYYSNGLLKQTTQGNGVVTEVAYNGLRMQGLQHKKSDGSVINAYSYGYDTNGNINSRTTNGLTDVFQYDSLNRISTSSQFNESYQYDSRGNRSNMSTSNPFDSAASDLSYDTRNRLTQVTTTDGKTVSYTYNGDGLLWERSEGGKTTRYYWDGDQVIAEAIVTGGTAKFHARYIRGKGLEAREDAQGKAYYLKNGHGDVVELRDSSGSLKLNHYDYDIFGNMTVQNELIPQPFKYSGEMTDSTTELQYLRARWYDPSIGRFVGEDTYEGDIRKPSTLNLYTYVRNNPLGYIDPSGNKDLPFGSSGGGGGGVGYDIPITYHDLLDVIGLIPVVGEFADGVNAIGYLIEGNYAYALLSTGAMVPIMGWSATSTKIIVRTGDAVSDASASKIMKNASRIECNCFTAGTKVVTDEGEKPIEEIEVGDKVLAKSDENGEVAYKEVVGLFQKQADEIYKVHIGDEVIEATAEHPFWLDGKGWTEVKDLKVGDLLVTSGGATLAIDKIEKEPRKATVYNFEVADFHSYFVSNLGIWVHNCNVNPGDLTPGGRTLSGHAAWRVNNRGFTVEIIDNIIANNKKSRVSKIDAEGKKTWEYTDSRGNTVVTNENGDKIVTVFSPDSDGNYIPKPKR